MRKHLKIALMAAVVATSFLTPLTLLAQSGTRSHITATTDDTGRTIYVNDAGPVNNGSNAAPATESRRPSLVYWSSKEHRCKPVPTSGAIMRAAECAGAR